MAVVVKIGLQSFITIGSAFVGLEVDILVFHRSPQAFDHHVVECSAFPVEPTPQVPKLPPERTMRATKPRVPQPLVEWKLDDQVSQALARIGVTEERVTAWIGAPCGCAMRREKLNKLSKWAQSAVKSEAEKAAAKLAKLLR